MASAQSADTAETETVRGTVLNSVTREPIPGALVVSRDNRFATRTDNQGRFEFTVPQAQKPQPPAEGPALGAPPSEAVNLESLRSLALSARKPGFLENSNASAADLAQKSNGLTLLLVPEAVIAGHVSLPASEAPDNIGLQLLRRVVQNGLAQWLPVGNTTSKSNGDFRFANLHAGVYKLLTRQLLERDPLSSGTPEQQYGYPPVYYPDATDLASAEEIELSPGQTAEPSLSLVKQPYYRVQVALTNPPPGDVGMNINVSGQKGHTGPGYALGYNAAAKRIEGWLPNGTYVVDATANNGHTMAAGASTLVVKGAPVTGAGLQLLPASPISVEVKEEFTGKEAQGSASFTLFNNGNRRSFAVYGPRAYLNVSLEPADEFNSGGSRSLRPPSGPDDTALQFDSVLPGRYWVRVQTSRGYVAAVRSGDTDLLREPLVVDAGSSANPIEITMRDDAAQISGQVEGLQPASPAPQSRTAPPAVVYCVPMPDSPGQLTEIGVSPDGSFSSPPMPPGDYRLLAFDRQQPELEYRDPEAMKLYDNRGPVVTIAAGQSQQITLPLISTQE